MSRKRQYEHGVVCTFLEEATTLCELLYKPYDQWKMKFHRDERTAKKAVWMLDIDCICTLAQTVDLLAERRHRPVGKLMRHALEAVDLSSLFHAEGDSSTHLRQWYRNTVVPHRRYREYLEKMGLTERAKDRKKVYELLSQWTHHTYYTICNSFTLGEGDYLVHDAAIVRGKQTSILITAETIYQYSWLLSVVMLWSLDQLKSHGFVEDTLIIDVTPTD